MEGGFVETAQEYGGTDGADSWVKTDGMVIN